MAARQNKRRGKKSKASVRSPAATPLTPLSKTTRLAIERVIARPATLAVPAAQPADAASSGRPTQTVQRTSGQKLRRRFEEQQRSAAWRKMLPVRTKLPATAARERVLKAVAAVDVTIISGGTGCGKSTQVPQFLLDEILTSGLDEASVVCTQPRRIAAVGVAERVAEERGSAPGLGCVGYRIRGESKTSADTRLTFCTVGLLLKSLESEPELKAHSTVIIDEVHERSLDADLLLLIARSLIAKHHRHKLVLMSATLNTKVMRVMG